MQRLWSSLLIAFLLLGFSRSLTAAAEIEIIVPEKVDYTFGNQITFRAQIQSDVPIEQVQIFFQSEGETQAHIGNATLDPNGEATYVHDLTSQPLRTFSKITYWFVVKPQSGQDYSSPKNSFVYIDNRFEWQNLEGQPFRIHWYDGDTVFGQSVLDIAQQGLRKAQELLSAPPPNEVNIYAYASDLEMQSTLLLAGVKNWVAGHADTDLGVIVVSLPAGPEQQIITKQRIPHELMHIMLFQLWGEKYRKIPAWLNEGLASVNELYPNPDYATILNKANEKDFFIPIASLCQTFPADLSNAYLAYAESEWFTRYLIEQFGASGIQTLIAVYADGVGCERGPEVALNKSLVQLERDWRQAEFGTNATILGLNDLLPWFLLLVIILVTPLLITIVNLRKKGQGVKGSKRVESQGQRAFR